MNIGEADAGRDGWRAGDGPAVQVGPPSPRSNRFLENLHLFDSGLVLQHLVHPHTGKKCLDYKHLFGSCLVRGERLSTFCCVIGSGLTKYFLHLVGGSDWFFNILIWFTSHPDSEESLRLDSEKKSARAKVGSHVNLRHSKT